MAEEINNDDLLFGVGEIDPATGKPFVKGDTIISADKLDDTQRGYLAQFAPDIDKGSFNDKGDIVDSTGKVILTKAELAVKLAKPVDVETEETKAARLLAETKTKGELSIEDQAKNLIKDNEGKVIQIDGVEYQIKNGVAVDKMGNTIFDSTILNQKMVESLTNTDDVSYIDEISKLTGYTPVDDKGNPVIYEDSVEGYAKYINDVVSQESARVIEERENGFFNEFPVLKDAYNFLRINGSLEQFGNITNHAKVILDKDNIDQLTSVIIEAEMLRGRTKEQASRLAKYAKDDNRMLEEAKDSLTFIQTKEVNEESARATRVAEIDAAAELQANTYWNGIKQTISKGELEGYVIPTNIQVRNETGAVINKTRDDFYNFVSQSVDNQGNSAAAVARAKKGAELELLIDYVMFTGGDLKQLVNLQVKRQTAQSAKLQIGANKDQKTKVIIGKAGDNSKANNDDII